MTFEADLYTLLKTVTPRVFPDFAPVTTASVYVTFQQIGGDVINLIPRQRAPAIVAQAGLANATFLFALPGSTSACRTGWDKLIRAQLDARTKPCNLANLRPRLRET